MLDLPLGKALIAVPSAAQCHDECMQENYRCTLDCCGGCAFHDDSLWEKGRDHLCDDLCCTPGSRKDSTNVVFKLVDL
ncbi:MAG: hypothetical protein LBB83_06875 [Treponema sp.]|jgi:hypothetical protein|nr:hypothetical protein [Treponema sp.]